MEGPPRDPPTTTTGRTGATEASSAVTGPPPPQAHAARRSSHSRVGVRCRRRPRRAPPWLRSARRDRAPASGVRGRWILGHVGEGAGGHGLLLVIGWSDEG